MPDIERGAGYWRAHNPDSPAVGDVDYLRMYISPSISVHYDDIGLANMIDWAFFEYLSGVVMPFRMGRVSFTFDYQRIGATMTLSLDDLGECLHITGDVNE